jgi:hypothetical protein
VSAIPEPKPSCTPQPQPKPSYTPQPNPYPQRATAWDLPPIPPAPFQAPIAFNPRGPVPVLLSNEFEVAWAKYPNRSQKERALREWGALQPKLADVLKSLKWQVTTEDFQGDACPIFAYYLKDKRWQDELPQAVIDEQNMLKERRKRRLQNYMNTIIEFSPAEAADMLKDAHKEFKDDPNTARAIAHWEKKQADKAKEKTK